MPWLGLTLALSFGFYGLLRKQVKVSAAVGLWVETTFMLPIALLFLLWLLSAEGLRPATQVMQLALGGLISVVPLVFFAAAALRLPLATLGFVQYLAPSPSIRVTVRVSKACASTSASREISVLTSGTSSMGSARSLGVTRIALSITTLGLLMAR